MVCLLKLGEPLEEQEKKKNPKQKKQKKGLQPETLPKIINCLDSCNTMLSEMNINTSLVELIEVLENTLFLYENHQAYIKGEIQENDYIANSFRFILQDTEERVSGKQVSTRKSRKLSILCLNPGFGFANFLKCGPKSLILTSGTLSPLNGLESELKCRFPIKLENDHVIDSSQVKFLQLCKFPKEEKRNIRHFTFNKDAQKNKEMIKDLGETIVDLCKITKGGVLVFFSSFHFINTCIDLWADENIISELNKHKQIFVDGKNSVDKQAISTGSNLMTEFRYAIENKVKNGALLMSVCKGSISEGVDFADDLARLVIIVGIPFPNFGDMRVQLKREYLNQCRFQKNFGVEGIKKLSDNEWYNLCATKAINQAMGRVIRHKSDYGAICLIDSRYYSWDDKSYSSWLRGKLEKHYDRKLYGSLMQFFKGIKALIKELEDKSQQADIDIENSNRLSNSKKADCEKISDNRHKQGCNHGRNNIEFENYCSEKSSIRQNSLYKLSRSKVNPKGVKEEELDSRGNILDNYKTKRNKIVTSKNDNMLKLHSKSSKTKANKEINKEVSASLTEKETSKVDDLDNDSFNLDDIISNPINKDSDVLTNKNSKVINQQINDMIDEVDKDNSPQEGEDITSIEKFDREVDSKAKEYIKSFDPETIKQLMKAYNIVTEVDPTKKQCGICFELQENFKAAKCGHVCCDKCWEKALQVKPKCPYCKSAVRKDKLIRLYNN